MHPKDIKLIIRKQLKKQFPNWKRLSRKEKKEIALGIEQQMPTRGIINLDSMAQLVDTVSKSRITKLSNSKRSAIYIKDKELQFVDELLDDRILNRLLANEGYRPAKRDLFPNNFFRAELLKAIKFPEIRYRKFCT